MDATPMAIYIRIMMIVCWITTAVTVIVLMSSEANAQIARYHGIDRVTAPSITTATNSLAAEADWLNDAALRGPIQTVDFESMAVGTTGFAHLIASGVTMRSMDPGNYLGHGVLTVSQAVPHYGLFNGFNTTSGGSNIMRFEQHQGDMFHHRVTFTFDQPVQAFSLFVTGEGVTGHLGDRMSTKFFLDGATTPAMDFDDLDHRLGDDPNARFGGFIAPNGSYTTVTLETRFYSAAEFWNSGFSFDDVRWVYTVPGPGGVMLGLVGCAMGFRRRR